MVAGSKKITPEEKLLHLIENTQEKNKLSPKKEIQKIKIFFTSIPSAISKLSFNINFRRITLRTVNKVLIALSFTATIVFFFYWTAEKSEIEKEFDALQIQKTDKSLLPLDLQQDVMPTAETYIAAAANNNPFHVLPTVQERETIETSTPLNFKLVGILWSNQAQAIIEDSSTEETYLVAEGDILDVYTVTKITQTEVTLRSKDGEKTLQ
ncbi:MAG: hypothetical protein ABIH09_02650 [Candidatus Omnitrophota bacterium]